MLEPPQETTDPLAADAAAKRTAAIRAWQKERLEDLASGQGGFVHIGPSEKALPAALPAADEPPGGLVGGARQAAEIFSASLSAEPQPETTSSPSSAPPNQPDEPGGEMVPPDSVPDEEIPAFTEPPGQSEAADPRPGAERTMPAERTDDTARVIAEEEFDFVKAEGGSAPEKRVAFWILIYETIWLAALTGTLLALPMFRIRPETAQLISAGLIAALGGTVGAVLALLKQTSRTAGSKNRHPIWYFSQPVIGFPLGMFVFMVLQATVEYSAGTGSAVIHPALLYAACAFTGFRQDILTGFASLFRSRANRQ